eukprot:6171945-Pleurochrysis_carterae.AAC.1
MKDAVLPAFACLNWHCIPCRGFAQIDGAIQPKPTHRYGNGRVMEDVSVGWLLASSSMRLNETGFSARMHGNASSQVVDFARGGNLRCTASKNAPECRDRITSALPPQPRRAVKSNGSARHFSNVEEPDCFAAWGETLLSHRTRTQEQTVRHFHVLEQHGPFFRAKLCTTRRHSHPLRSLSQRLRTLHAPPRRERALTLRQPCNVRSHLSDLATRLQFGHCKLQHFSKRARHELAVTEPSTVAYRPPARRMIDVQHAWSS